MPIYLTGERLQREHKTTSDGSTICNPRFRIMISDWDSRCKEELTTGPGLGLRRKEKQIRIWNLAYILFTRRFMVPIGEMRMLLRTGILVVAGI